MMGQDVLADPMDKLFFGELESSTFFGLLLLNSSFTYQTVANNQNIPRDGI
jgi:hypothetical protein